MMRRGIGRVGRPRLVGTMARTAVIAGTATAVSGGVRRRQDAKAQAQADEYQQDVDQAAAQQAAPPPPPPPPAAAPRRLPPAGGMHRGEHQSAQGARPAEGSGDPLRGGVRGQEGPDPRTLTARRRVTPFRDKRSISQSARGQGRASSSPMGSRMWKKRSLQWSVRWRGRRSQAGGQGPLVHGVDVVDVEDHSPPDRLPRHPRVGGLQVQVAVARPEAAEGLSPPP